MNLFPKKDLHIVWKSHGKEFSLGLEGPTKTPVLTGPGLNYHHI